jgi:hypothetical protein
MSRSYDLTKANRDEITRAKNKLESTANSLDNLLLFGCFTEVGLSSLSRDIFEIESMTNEMLMGLDFTEMDEDDRIRKEELR